jgi:hypothetical protein
MEALRALDDSQEVEPVAALYAPDAVLGNVITPDHFHGPAGARTFWKEYRGTFGTAVSTFRNVIASEGRAALEWTTEGTNLEGKPFQYMGVTILEIDGAQITRSCAYFDPQGLGRQITE